jgi:hypothetical protein
MCLANVQPVYQVCTHLSPLPSRERRLVGISPSRERRYGRELAREGCPRELGITPSP